MSYLRDILYTYEPDAIAAHNAFCRAIVGHSILLDDDELRIHGVTNAVSVHTDLAITVSTANIQLTVGVSTADISAFSTACITDLQAEEIALLPINWKTFLIADVLVRGFEEIEIEQIEVSPLKEQATFNSDAISTVQVSIGDQIRHLPVLVKMFPDLHSLVSPPDVVEKMPELPITFSIDLHPLSVSLAELNTVSPGAVILLRTAIPTSPEEPEDTLPCVLRVGTRVVAEAKLHGRTLTVTRIEPDDFEDRDIEISHAISELPLENDSPQISALDNIEVTLSFVLHRETMPLSQLAKLIPGQILQLKSHPDLELQIVSGGRIIGTGTLLSIGEQIGVQLTEWIGMQVT